MRYRLTFMGGLAVGYVLGARAGRERYEQMRKAAQQFAQNPTVQDAARNAADAAQAVAAKAVDKVGDTLGDKLPESVGERVRYLREKAQEDNDDDWGTNT
jgi:sugar/nucleoside kinase (ribokinase family)